MSSTHNFTFDRMSRIGTDLCSLNQGDMQNVKNNNYMLTNHFVKDCNMKKPITFATQQPNVNYSGSHSVGIGGCNIDENSFLTVGKIPTNTPCKLSLLQRPYLTVPYLGKGNVDVNQETFILHGEQLVNKKSINQLSEQSYMKYSNIPMIPSLQNSITDPSHIVEGVASEGWVRGGVASRELQRDRNV